MNEYSPLGNNRNMHHTYLFFPKVCFRLFLGWSNSAVNKFLHNCLTSFECVSLIDSSLGLPVSASGFMSISLCSSERSRRHNSCIFAGRLTQSQARHGGESINTKKGVRTSFIIHNIDSCVLHSLPTSALKHCSDKAVDKSH